MVTLLIATHNPHKVAEIQSLLGLTYRCRHLAEFSNVPTVIEDGATFAENAGKKALTLASWWETTQTGSVVDLILADDSGLEVDALAGAPGVHSARCAALASGQSGNATDADNNARLLALLKDVPVEKRTARFKCVIAVVRVNLEPSAVAKKLQLFTGVCEGRVALACRGQTGFGYDPLFVPVGFEQTFAELGATFKNRLSHRAQALRQVQAWLATGASIA